MKSLSDLFMGTVDLCIMVTHLWVQKSVCGCNREIKTCVAN